MIVLCIDGDFSWQEVNKPWPQFMKTYTVIDFRQCDCGCGQGGYQLEELPVNHPFIRHWISKNFVEVQKVSDAILEEVLEEVV